MGHTVPTFIDDLDLDDAIVRRLWAIGEQETFRLTKYSRYGLHLAGMSDSDINEIVQALSKVGVSLA